MPADIMCNGHRFVKSTLFNSPGYLADLSPYISAVISSRLLATPIQLTASAIKPLAPLAQSLLPTRATNFILSGTLTCEYCLHQVSQESFDDGKICPALLLDNLGLSNDEVVLADQILEAQDKRRIELYRQRKTEEGDSKETGGLSCTSEASTSSRYQSSGETLTSSSRSKDDRGSPSKVRSLSDDPQAFKEDILIMKICPEVGLHSQRFTCVDCDKKINLNNSRLCHYDGRYYCYNCHTGSDLVPIPASVIRNWDFTPKPVSKSSMQKICYLRTKPVLFNLFQMNSMLYGFIDQLVLIKQIRERIQSMLKYVEICGQPNKPDLVSIPYHIKSKDLLNFFALNDLFEIDQTFTFLSDTQANLELHIVRKCESCRGKGFYCELCKDPHDVLYPFSKNGVACSRCQAVYHKNCFHRKKRNCPRCARLNLRRSSASSAVDDSTSFQVTDDVREPLERIGNEPDFHIGQTSGVNITQ